MTKDNLRPTTVGRNIEGLINHPFLRLPDCLQNTLYAANVQASFDQQYHALRKHYAWHALLPPEPIYGRRLLDLLEGVFEPDGDLTWEGVVNKYEGLLEKQRANLRERVGMLSKALPSLDMRVIPDQVLASCFQVANNNQVPENVPFQRALMRVTYCKSEQDVGHLVKTLRNKLLVSP